MIDGTDLVSLATATRDYIGEDEAGLWTEAKVYRAINDEVTRLARKVIDIGNGWLEVEKDYTAAATITLPANCYVVRSISAYVGSVWYPIPWISAHQQVQYQTLGTTPEYPMSVRFVNNTLVTEGYAAASTLRVRYARMPAAMMYATVSSATSTTFVLTSGSVLDDAYIGDTVVTLAGTGSGQSKAITDYVASTKTFTVATWASTPDATTTLAWCLPDPLDKWPDLVAMGAAIRLLWRRRDTEMVQNLLAVYANDLGDMMNALAQRQTNEPQRINYLPDGSE